MNLSVYLEIRGRVNALAAAIGVDPVVVSQWKTGARPIPAHHCPEIERATAGVVTCEELRPDVSWGVLRTARHLDRSPVTVFPTKESA